MAQKSVIVLFLDGVGLGDSNPEANPFMHVDMQAARQLLGVKHLTRQNAGATNGSAALLAVDASMGVDGLPQSGTGQTAILTGKNAPALLGEHLGPYPNPPLRTLLAEESIFKTLLDAGQPVAYANAYPDRFLDRVKRGKGRLSANTTAAYKAGLKLRGSKDLQQGRALSALFSNEFWPEPDVKLPSLSAYQAGEQLVSLSRDHTLTFFEFWYSDVLGHKMRREESLKILGMLDDFLAGILATIDPHTLLLVISDHGNFEDWTTKKHTDNPALGILAGQGVDRLAPQLQSLTDVNPMLLSYIFDGEVD